jgi:hypothetical protein
MLISLGYKFIFIANKKAASTAVERALCDYAEIALVRSEWGKHRPLRFIASDFPTVFDLIPRRDFFVFGIVREPLDWLRSLYRSHKSIKFEHTNLSTKDMTFSDFIRNWLAEHPDQSCPQADMFVDDSGLITMNCLIRFEDLEQEFLSLSSFIGIPKTNLDLVNSSVDIGLNEDLTESDKRLVNELYEADFALYERCCSCIPATHTTEDDDHMASPNNAHYGLAAKFEPATKVSRDDVIWAYRFILNRDPESEAAITDHLQCETRWALRDRLFQSAEFSQLWAGSARHG